MTRTWINETRCPSLIRLTLLSLDWWKAPAHCDFQPDLVVFQWWTVFWAPAWAWMGWQLHRNGLKIIFFIHNVLPHEPRRVDPWLARLALRQADGYITLTEREKQRLNDLFRGCSKPIFTTPCLLSAWNAAPVSKTDARTRLGLPEDIPFYYFRLVRQYKGLQYLIEAADNYHEPSRLW